MDITSEPLSRRKKGGKKRKGDRCETENKRPKVEETEARPEPFTSAPGTSTDDSTPNFARRQRNPKKHEGNTLIPTTTNFERLVGTIMSTNQKPTFLLRNVVAKTKVLKRRSRSSKGRRKKLQPVLSRLTNAVLDRNGLRMFCNCKLEKVFGWSGGQDVGDTTVVVRTFFVAIDAAGNSTLHQNGMSWIPNVKDGNAPLARSLINTQHTLIRNDTFSTMERGYLATIATRRVVKEARRNRRPARGCTPSLASTSTEVETITRYGALLVYDKNHRTDPFKTGLQQIAISEKDECSQLTKDLDEGSDRWMSNLATLAFLDGDSRRCDNSHSVRIILVIERDDDDDDDFVEILDRDQRNSNENEQTPNLEIQVKQEIDEEAFEPMEGIEEMKPASSAQMSNTNHPEDVPNKLEIVENDDGEQGVNLPCTRDVNGRYRCGLTDLSFGNLSIMKIRLEARFPCFRIKISQTDFDGAMCFVMGEPDYFDDRDVFLERTVFFWKNKWRATLIKREVKRLKTPRQVEEKRHDPNGLPHHCNPYFFTIMNGFHCAKPTFRATRLTICKKRETDLIEKKGEMEIARSNFSRKFLKGYNDRLKEIAKKRRSLRGRNRRRKRKERAAAKTIREFREAKSERRLPHPCITKLFFPRGKTELYNIIFRFFFGKTAVHAVLYDCAWVTDFLMKFIRQEYEFICATKLDDIFLKQLQCICLVRPKWGRHLNSVFFEFKRLRRAYEESLEAANRNEDGIALRIPASPTPEAYSDRDDSTPVPSPVINPTPELASTPEQDDSPKPGFPSPAAVSVPDSPPDPGSSHELDSMSETDSDADMVENGFASLSDSSSPSDPGVVSLILDVTFPHSSTPEQRPDSEIL